MRTKGVKNYKLKFNLKLKNFANDEWLDKGNYASLQQIICLLVTRMLVSCV